MMITLALMMGLSLSELPALAAEVEAEARALAGATEANAALRQGLENLAEDAARLAGGLDRAGVGRDMGGAFGAIAADARARAADLAHAVTPADRAAALARARIVLEDAAMLAPMAAAAAADAAATRKLASN